MRCVRNTENRARSRLSVAVVVVGETSFHNRLAAQRMHIHSHMHTPIADFPQLRFHTPFRRHENVLDCLNNRAPRLGQVCQRPTFVKSTQNNLKNHTESINFIDYIQRTKTARYAGSNRQGVVEFMIYDFPIRRQLPHLLFTSFSISQVVMIMLLIAVIIGYWKDWNSILPD